MRKNDFAIERTDTALTIRSRNVRGWRLGYPVMAIGAAIIWWALQNPHDRAADPWPLLIGVAFVGIGVAFLLPYGVTTTFDLRAREVHQTVWLWKRVRHRVIAFGDIASIGFYQPDLSEPRRWAVIRLKRSDQVRIVTDGNVLEERVVGLVAAVTGLPKIDTVYAPFIAP